MTDFREGEREEGPFRVKATMVRALFKESYIKKIFQMLAFNTF